MGSDSDADDDTSPLTYPREPNGPSADCPNCDDLHGRVSVAYSTKGRRGDHDLNKFVVARCDRCGTKLGEYELARTETVREGP